MSSKKQNEPYVLVHGSYKDPKQSFLITDRRVVCEVDIKDVPLALMSAFFVYNICYTKGCDNVYAFLEHSVLGLSHKKLSPSVDHFLAALHVHA